MDSIVKITIIVCIILISLAVLVYLAVRYIEEKMMLYYGAKRKQEKESVVRNVRIDHIDD